ncbi:hypothetical protein BVC80_8659g11 [Macleaya cordata]|uniref:G-patch domain n=1 Tax=Macleaya cordata TaxID=56857 RepID=A0A200Q2Z7_MACCD|nr:hypothetical protein BVC80_8659g11 [Macleaya cordata]
MQADNPSVAVQAPLFQVPQQKSTEQKEEDELIVEQLKRTTANVSVWGLLEAPTRHRNAVLEALSSIQVSTEITPDELVATVAHVHSIQTISFSDEDLPKEGPRHNRALNITIGWNHLVVPLVLIDNGSGVNICTLQMVKLMGLTGSDMAFSDGTIRSVKGDIDEHEDTANQRGKNMVPMIESERQLCNYAEEDANLLVRRPALREKILSRFDYGNQKIAYLMRTQRYFPGMGLRRNLHGRTEPLSIDQRAPQDTFGLGYQPIEAEIARSNAEKWFVKKCQCPNVPTIPKKVVVIHEEVVLEDIKDEEPLDDTLLEGMSRLYTEEISRSESEEVKSQLGVFMIQDCSELEDTASSEPSEANPDDIESNPRTLSNEKKMLTKKREYMSAKSYRLALNSRPKPSKKPRMRVFHPQKIEIFTFTKDPEVAETWSEGKQYPVKSKASITESVVGESSTDIKKNNLNQPGEGAPSSEEGDAWSPVQQDNEDGELSEEDQELFTPDEISSEIQQSLDRH